MASETVTLGGRQYTLSTKSMGADIRWREHFRQSGVIRLFQNMDSLTADLMALVDAVGEGSGQGLDNGIVIRLVNVLPFLINTLSQSIDDVIAMLFDYSPELAADKEWLMDNAQTEEAVEAFCAVLRLCFPITALRALVHGPRVQATQSNLPTVNGASGMKVSAPRKR